MERLYVKELQDFVRACGAQGAIALVIRGHSGSAQVADITLSMAMKLPALMRRMADDLEADAKHISEQVASGQHQDSYEIHRTVPGETPEGLS